MRKVSMLGAAWMAATLLMTAWPRSGAAQKSADDLTVHEWGTFLTMSGSDGVTLDGMYHEEHALPDFVHARSKDQLRMHSALTKGETPVIYFYTKRPQAVRVRVDFPGGLWTQWYPQANLVGPGLTGVGAPPNLHNGHIEWQVDILPASSKTPALPATSKDALWNYARDVDAAFVSTTDHTTGTARGEMERFLFYRGLGSAKMPLEASSSGGGTLALKEENGATAESVHHLFILRVENGKGVYRYIPSLKSGESLSKVIPAMTGAKPMAEFTKSISDDLAGRLVESGLYEKEARAMVNTWKNSYFGSEGVRVLYVLSPEWTDKFIPMQLEPRPAKLVRVMVGRTELLTAEREKRAEAAVGELASTDSATREKAYAFLRDQGRYVEPILRRVQRSTQDDRTRSLCSRLLLSGFVNDLRAANLSAADGSRVTEPTVYLRAQLSALLREIGLTTEAKEEGTKALIEIQKMERPRLDNFTSRGYLRAEARAMEGMGDVPGAIRSYEEFIKFGSQTKDCGGCHHEEGPRNMAFYRDWWAGRKYADNVRQSGQLEQVIRDKQELLKANRTNMATQMMLAYLYEARGDTRQSEQMWAGIGVAPIRAASTSAPIRAKEVIALDRKRK